MYPIVRRHGYNFHNHAFVYMGRKFGIDLLIFSFVSDLHLHIIIYKSINKGMIRWFTSGPMQCFIMINDIFFINVMINS